MIPPLAVGLVAAFLIWLTALEAPAFRLVFPGHLAVAAALALLGGFISISGVISFRRARTTVNPMRPNSASALVVSGMYRFTRNPMYLGFLLVLLGWVAVCSNALTLGWIVAFVAYMNRFQILPEERALAALFGPDFFSYKTKVRRWI